MARGRACCMRGSRRLRVRRRRYVVFALKEGGGVGWERTRDEAGGGFGGENIYLFEYRRQGMNQKREIGGKWKTKSFGKVRVKVVL